ncbi:hypothetical protein [Portibacter lacus]|uniref:Uncharacterized protein n=1 Tax=Portibacter lacus TaxID=1099794 RepID=A0AA37SVS5_9BACT|nr:hypothetical protein [Portibacter lacus]GLR19686.1 hypothetical protein GCM10007940_43020 [Portibacter lacus]
MKSNLNFSYLLFFVLITLSSCSKLVDPEGLENKQCEFSIDKVTLDPVCSFNPRVNPTVNFPVRILYNGQNLDHSEFGILWSSDPDFKSNAISIS